MNVLVVPVTGGALDPAIPVGQSLARWSGGQWRVLHALGGGVNNLIRRGTQAEHARRMVQLVARPDLPPTRQRITFRSLKSVFREEVKENVDVVVTNADRASDGWWGGSLAALVDSAGLPVLAVRDIFDVPPRRISIVTEPRDMESHSIRSAVSWILALFGPNGDKQPTPPVEVDLVHVARTRLDWSVAEFRFAEQAKDSLGQTHVNVRGARPELPAHIPEALDRFRPDLVVVFQDRRNGKHRPRLGSLARKLVKDSSRPVMLLPPAPLLVNHSGDPEHPEPVSRDA